MPFSNSPQFSTYKTVDVPFTVTDQFRDGNSSSSYSDARIINMYYDPIKDIGDKGLMRIMKRPGMADSNMSLSKVSPTDVLRGFFYNTDNLALYWVVGNKVKSIVPNPTGSPTVREVQTLTTSSGAVGFCSYFRSDGVQFVVISDGTDVWLDNWAITTVTEITDPDMPSPHIPSPVYLDGYLLLIDAGTQNIYNSDPDDPFNWSVDNFIQAEINSDTLLKLIKVRNYMVALGTESVEFFWDAGNATGSPFSRNDSAVNDVGYLTSGTFIGNQYYFIGQDRKKNIGVFRLDGFKCERVSMAVIDRQLQGFLAPATESNRPTLNVDGHSINFNGHNFYVVNTSTSTWMLDTAVGAWYEWTTSTSTPIEIEASWQTYNGYQYVALQGRSTITQVVPSLYQDFGVDFAVSYTTGNNWHETYNWKICHRAAVKMNKVTSGSAINVSVNWTDDDGLNFTTARNIDLRSASAYLSRCGRFRRRSWKIAMTANQPLILEGMVLDLNVQGI